MESGFFLVADLLGFGKIVSNSSASELDARIDAWVHLVELVASQHGVERFQLISDTLFVGVPADSSDLRNLLEFSKALLSQGIRSHFSIRGAITYGDYTWGKLTYGRAVIDAYKLEQAQNWVGISCDPSTPTDDALWSPDLLVAYPPPLRGARIQIHGVVSWDVPEPDDLMRMMGSGGVFKKGDFPAWDYGEKVNNTVLFGLYQKLLRKKGVAADKFHGLLPCHPVATALGSLLARDDVV